ncbi:MAG: hypothetical protein HQK53_13910 [Oligoflexia bacterium]|nr:hypothetical protein [Oligoflexia bacterium]
MIIQALKRGATKALAQIEKNNYAAEMRERGIKEILKIGIAFAGKRFSNFCNFIDINSLLMVKTSMSEINDILVLFQRGINTNEIPSTQLSSTSF